MKYLTFQELAKLWNLSEKQVSRIVKKGEYKGKKLTIKEEKLLGGGNPKKLVLYDFEPLVILPSIIEPPKVVGLPDGFFIDKLNVKQTHQSSDLRLVGKQACYYFDLQTGEAKETPYITHLQHEGSFSSALTIRCDGTTVEVYGNPSRFGRVDNLFGFQTLDECFALYNAVLQKLGLPPFTKCTKYLYFSGGQIEGKKASKTTDGAIISHIDVTRNLSVGCDNEKTYLKALSTQSIGKSVKPYLYADENTVDWYGSNIQKNGSTYRYIKCYNKHNDLVRHQQKVLKTADSASIAYYDKLLSYCLEQGVIREEHSFKRPLLKKLNCFAWGLFSENDLVGELHHITDIRKRLEVAKMNYASVADELLERKICKTRLSANTTQSYYFMWLHGQELDTKKKQFRLHKSRLLQIGIDISVKLDISRASPIRLKSMQVIEVKVLTAPDWYKKPILRLVAQ